MRQRSPRRLVFLFGLPFVVCLALAQVWAEPAPAKPATFAPAADLAARIDYYLKRIDSVLSEKDDYDESRQNRLALDARGIAISALALSLSPDDHPLKASSPGMITAANKLADSVKNFDAATQAAAALKAAKSASGAAGGTPAAWRKVADASDLMKLAVLLQGDIDRGSKDEKRFKRQAADVAGAAATLGAIAQELTVDGADYATGEKTADWQKFCSQFQAAAAESHAAAKAGDQPRAAAAASKIVKSCEACHAVFHSEDK